MQKFRLLSGFNLFALILVIAFSACASDPGTIILKNKDLIFQQGQYDMALQNLEEAVQKNPRSAALWYWLGIARYHKAKHKEAITAFEKAFELKLYKTYHVSAFHYLGGSHYLLRNYDKSIEYFSRALKLDPKYAPALTGRGWSFYGSNMHDEALRDFNMALNYFPGDQAALRGKGWAHYRKGNIDQAIESFTRAIPAIKPNRTDFLADTFKGRGWSYYYKGEFENARNDFNDAIKNINPMDPFALLDVHKGKAFSYLGLGDSETALNIIKKAEQYRPPPLTLDHELSLIYYVSGDKKKAWELRGGSAMIGVHIDNYNENGIKGARVSGIVEDSPARKAGILKDDIIIKLDGRSVLHFGDFTLRAIKLEPGKTAKVTLLREGFEKEIVVKAASAEPLMENNPLLKPVLANRKVPPSAESTIILTPSPAEPAGLDVSGAGEMPVPPKSLVTSVKIDSVVIGPGEVPAGKHFEVILDLIAEDPDTDKSELPVTMNYSVSKDGKTLKRFKAKEFMVPNGEYWSITRKPKAAKTKGDYTMEVELEYKDTKAEKSVDFTIK